MSLSNSQPLSQTHMNSALHAQHVIRPKVSKNNKWPLAALTLTSLVDCFTILVVYLLVATSFGVEQIDVPESIKLPHASHSDVTENGLIVRSEDGKFFIGDNSVAMEDLADVLGELRKTRDADAVTIMADRSETFEKLNPAVLSILQAGFAKVRFAVIQEDES